MSDLNYSNIQSITPQENGAYEICDKSGNELIRLPKDTLTMLIEAYNGINLKDYAGENLTVTEYGQDTQITFSLKLREHSDCSTLLCCRDNEVIGGIDTEAMMWMIKILFHQEENRPPGIAVTDHYTTIRIRFDIDENEFVFEDVMKRTRVTLPILALAYLRARFQQVNNGFRRPSSAGLYYSNNYFNGMRRIYGDRYQNCNVLIFDDSSQQVTIREQVFKRIIKFATGEQSYPAPSWVGFIQRR